MHVLGIGADDVFDDVARPVIARQQILDAFSNVQERIGVNRDNELLDLQVTKPSERVMEQRTVGYALQRSNPGAAPRAHRPDHSGNNQNCFRYHGQATAQTGHYSHDQCNGIESLGKSAPINSQVFPERAVFLDMEERIWKIIQENGRLPVDTASLSEDSDLYVAGMTSHASVNVMLALEDAFDIEFPDHMLKRSVFQSVTAISGALRELQAQQAA
jgi:acyl carrier protein